MAALPGVTPVLPRDRLCFEAVHFLIPRAQQHKVNSARRVGHLPRHLGVESRLGSTVAPGMHPRRPALGQAACTPLQTRNRWTYSRGVCLNCSKGQRHEWGLRYHFVL